MDNDRYARYGAATGIIAVALIMVGYGIATPNIPKVSASADDWLSWVTGHQNQIQFGTTITAVGLFFYIWFSNVIGFLPLPTNTENEIHIFGLAVPTFGIYAATANISVPLALTLVVWISYNVEGIRAKGFVGYFKSWLPPGLEDMNPIGKALIFVIEVISHLVRLISLSVRLFANILAGHLLLLFMGGGLAVLLGLAALGALTFPLAFAFFIFELGLIATLQAFIFSILTAIYIGGATAETH